MMIQTILSKLSKLQLCILYFLLSGPKSNAAIIEYVGARKDSISQAIRGLRNRCLVEPVIRTDGNPELTWCIRGGLQLIVSREIEDFIGPEVLSNQQTPTQGAQNSTLGERPIEKPIEVVVRYGRDRQTYIPAEPSPKDPEPEPALPPEPQLCPHDVDTRGNGGPLKGVGTTADVQFWTSDCPACNAWARENGDVVWNAILGCYELDMNQGMMVGSGNAYQLPVKYEPSDEDDTTQTYPKRQAPRKPKSQTQQTQQMTFRLRPCTSYEHERLTEPLKRKRIKNQSIECPRCGRGIFPL